MSLRRLTVRTRLTLSFASLALLIVLVAGFAAFSLSDGHRRFDDFVHGVNARLLLSYEIRTAVERRAIAARDLLNATSLEDSQTIRAELSKAHEDVKHRLARLKEMAAQGGVSDEARQHVARMAEIEVKYAPVALGIVDLIARGKREEAKAKMNAECRPLLFELIQAARDYRDFTSRHSEELLSRASQEYATQRSLLASGCMLAFSTALAFGHLIARGLSRALGAEPAELGEVARRVSAGDLSRVDGAAAAPAGSVLASLGEMQLNLAQIVGRVRSSSDSIVIGTAQIASGNSELSQRTEAQASSLQQTAASMEQLSVTVKTSADVAGDANLLASLAAETAKKGGEKVGHVVETMQDIAQASRKIADITGIIHGIAFQTNILALNAAVEAARAGEQGRGFAVVAGEVRSLAQRSAEAAKEIESLIAASADRVEAGIRQVDDAGATMGDIVEKADRVSQMIRVLSCAASEQSQTITQVVDSVRDLDQVTQKNAALVEETAAASESLKQQAELLAAAASQFRIAQPLTSHGLQASASPASVSDDPLSVVASAQSMSVI